MATLATQVISRAGVVEALTAAAGGGDAMACGDNFYLKVANGAAATMTVTIAIPTGASGWANAAYTNTAVVVPNVSNRLIGPIQAPLYADPVTGLATITYSSVTTVTVGAFNVQGP